MRMKLSDYVVDFLVRNGIRHAFIVSGGASIHLLHSLHNNPGIEYICPHHEQAGAMAAEAYSRVGGGIGCAIATSGPGATNMITGIAGAWFDSVPALYITGQVTTFRMKGDSAVRQFGFQETEILPMVKPITKYCAQLLDARDIRKELEKALYMAKSGRQGPVLIDIPDDLQRTMIETADLAGFVPDAAEKKSAPAVDPDDIAQVLAMMQSAKRPVLIFGWGVRLAGASEIARDLAERTGIPVLTSWAARDILPAGNAGFVGTFGTHGTRAGNFAVQNADLVIAIGARLSTRETGSPLSSWAREAETVIVDLDAAELGKFEQFGKPLDLAIEADAGDFIRALQSRANELALPDIAPWKARITGWQETYPVCTDAARADARIDPYALMQRLSDAAPEGMHIFSDTGCAVAWLMQGFDVKPGQRLYHDFNNTAMGWALPAAMAGSLALGRAPVLCVVGDGSLMMNLQELATIAYLKLPLRIVLLNNRGYAMVRQTEGQWLGGVNAGTSAETGLGFPDFAALARSCGIETFSLKASADTGDILKAAFAHDGPVFIDVEIDEHHGVYPQSKFGYPIEDSEPLLPREEFLASMIVAPMPKSLEPID